MKKLCIALVALAVLSSLNAYNRSPASVSYYNELAQELATMRTRDWKDTLFLKYADEGNLNGMKNILRAIPKKQWKIFINTGDKNNEHALVRAIRSGHSHIVSFLIQHGANPLKQNSARVNPLEGAAATIKFLDLYLKDERVKKDKYKEAWGH